jgi:hypothetical protein
MAENSCFGSEMIAQKQAVDMIEGLTYKLRMMGIPIDGVTNIFCDNEAAINSVANPESTLKKKHNQISWHWDGCGLHMSLDSRSIFANWPINGL